MKPLPKHKRWGNVPAFRAMAIDMAQKGMSTDCERDLLDAWRWHILGV